LKIAELNKSSEYLKRYLKAMSQDSLAWQNEDWDQLLLKIHNHKCTPFLGPGVYFPTLPLSADASAIGGENDRFGGLGRNGASVKFTPEAKAGQLLASSSTYSFRSGKLFNLEASAFISDHGAVHGKEVANAVMGAVVET
jgi:hypothetical protein